jgi:hypothetical protein
MPICVYSRAETAGKPPNIAWLCETSWELPVQISCLEAWLESEGRKIPQGDYVADIGFTARRNEGSGGAALSPNAMKIMGERGIELFLSEYPQESRSANA